MTKKERDIMEWGIKMYYGGGWKPWDPDNLKYGDPLPSGERECMVAAETGTPTRMTLTCVDGRWTDGKTDYTDRVEMYWVDGLA